MAGVTELVTAARARIENLGPAGVAAELADPFVLLVDVREPAETAYGTLPGAVLAPRGLLEFHADPASPRHLEGFARGRRVILYCADGARSALAARSLHELGFRDLAHLDGGLDAWIAQGRPMTGPTTGVR